MLNSKIEGKGEVICILHGLFGSLDNWASMSNMLSSNFEVHTIDNRNHGSSFHSDDISYELMVEDLKKYLDHNNLKKINLVGHSMGGKISMIFSCTYPEYINKLSIIDIAPKVYPNNLQHIADILVDLDLEYSNKRNELEKILNSKLKDINLSKFLIKNLFLNKNGKFEWRMNIKSLQKNMDKICQFKENLNIFEKETMFLKGEFSNYIKENDIDYINEYFSNYSIKEIKRSSHFVHIENKMDCYKELFNFFM